eukprot:CAMPEP_0115875376 /NCGR_PEP_ID=MMETSP0287-20121206/25065_1 /TAXON_ID=412157 /ORGANISM="Chrysochromulina rotalis, Strain UIO044" /LENGTH=84 /DNA_ID=CAMNT_0003330637 /DNA_START=437 /DNA_END=691 /DNA_ORIENTATION=-
MSSELRKLAMFGLRSRNGRAALAVSWATDACPLAVTRSPSPWSARFPVRLSQSSETFGRSIMCCAFRAASGVAKKMVRKSGDSP